ncbi:interferon-induced very large GTPase 1-like [Pseudophryne corroboree]|uniref:interferon-induced very large GTPase 1-like n=1 Tax=Pseudophryne corroboree TaxID=495146 RepID=UPI003081A1E5
MAEEPQGAGRPDESPETAASNDLSQKLKEGGLNPKKWMKVFSSIGVKSAHSLQCMGAKDYTIIKKHAEWPWEEQALRNLINVPDPQDSLNKTKEEQTKQKSENQAKANKGLEETKKVVMETKIRLDKKEESQAETLQKSKSLCVGSSNPVEPLEGQIEKLHGALSVKDKAHSSIANLSDEDILLNASGGLALEGIYLTKNQEDILEKREQLLAVPKGISLTNSRQSPVLDHKEFSSSVAESVFHKSMEKLGFSIATAAKVGFGGFQADGSFGYSTTSISKQKQESHTERTYISTTKYNYIPLASCYITKEQLYLSSAALNELKTIEVLEEHCNMAEKPNFLRERYENFFHRFGSHANQGPLQFGGIFWWTVTSQGFKQELIEEIKNENKKALSAAVNLSYSGLWSASGSIDVAKTEAKESSNKVEKIIFEKDIQLFVTKTGGPLTVDSLTEWQLGLNASNKTWSVIDRGSSLTPVWEIILFGHKENFKNVYQVAQNLKDIYGAITSQQLSLTIGENVSTAIYEANVFLSGLKSWEAASAQEKLNRLIEFRQYLNEKTGNFNVWLNVCLPHKELQGFLENVMEFYKQTSKSDESLICGQLKLLLQDFTYSSENIDSYFPIYKWIYPSKKEQETNISNFSSFINFLSQAQRDLLQLCPSVDSEEEALKAQVKFTVIIHSYVNSFLKTLRYMEQTEEELLVLCAASSVGYSVQDNYFRYCLGWEEVNFMVEEIKSLFKEYKNLRDLQVYKAQSFIFAAGLSSGDKKRPQSTEQKKELLQLMLEKMKSSLEVEIQHILKNYSGFSDLQSLLEDLNGLISGNYKTNIKVNSENLAKEIKNVCERTNQPPTTEPQARVPIARESDTSLNQDVINLMVRLGLDQYFPKGLNRRHFHVVHTSLLNQTEKESDLPLQFMQMLMRLDYRFRYLVCKDNSKNSLSGDLCKPENETSTFETLEDLLNYCSETESNTVPTSKETIHPVDLLMAIYHCSDDFMRQYTFTKLSTCQFALPFIVPRPYDTVIELPLWAFRQVQKSILDTETKKHEEKLISQTDVPMVCFTRLGTSPFSKSQILNNLLTKHRHDIFFHRNCEGSIKTRILMDGMAEIFWFCPGGKDTDQFEKCTAFVNLRGDVREHKRQAAFLQNISSVNVMLFSQSEMNDFKNVMSTNQLKEKPLIILLADKEIPVHVHKESKQVIIGLKNQNEAKVLEELTKSLRRLLASSAKSCSLEACAITGRQCEFLVDEDSEECVEGKHHAQTMLSLLKQNDLMKSKEELLPLSGHLWHSWCKIDKELTRLQNKMNQSIEQHCSKIEAEKTLIRETQLEKASQNQFIKNFIIKLKSLSKTSKLFFLQWFKILIDNLSCDRVLKLREEYNSLWTQLQSEQLEDKELAKTLPDKLENLSVQMNAYMFGLEHVLREVGQMYEALYDLHHTDECFYELPKIAADMMLSGYPIELMDGDACYVPLKWIKAVLQELIKIIGDKKLFVLSVLGVQSSGKSTLLNTMFGLQFAVSAGRCTRGAFMQLIELFDDLKIELGFDYILVVDTEGLRAMELSSQSTLNHDNELATFAIGVGNMTLINVYGENPAEIKDILQIAVQAFLRMKQVKLSSSCLFVHQNVGDLTALDKNMEGRRKLQKELDKMTALAAEHELCNVQCFSEVIRFDPKHHIKYFAHLWEGNPPMAPPNPHYSEDTQKVKDSILHPRRGDPHSILTISRFIIRIEDLWSALRNENFVFSFKNTLEISVYSKVENKYRQLTWELRRHFLELQAKLNNRIKKGDVTSVSQKDIEMEVKEKFEAVKEDFESFFNEDKDKEILIQWKANTENRLNSLQNELIEETKRQGTEHIRLLMSQNQVKRRQTGYEVELFGKSKQLALDIKKEGLQESELRDHFNLLWQEWVAEITRNAPHADEPNIIADAENILLDYFNYEPSMTNKLTNRNKWMLFCVDLSKHAAVHKGFFRSYHLNESDRMHIQKVFNDLVTDIRGYLGKKQRERGDYNQAYFHSIIYDVTDDINKKNSSKMFKKFTLTTLFKFDVSLYLFGMAVPIFQSMHKAFRNANDPVLNLESKRGEFYNCFTIACQGAASIKTFADLLCSKLLEAIHPALYSRTALAIVDEMTCNYPAFSGNRSKLEAYILIDLAEQEDFEQYRQYLHFPEKYFRTFIEKCVENYCFDKGSHKLKDFLHISLDRFQQMVLLSIRESTRLLKNKSSNVSEWLDDFYNRIEDLVTFSRADLKGIEHQEIQDIEFIQEAMCTAWDSAVETFKKNLETTNVDCFEKKPHEILAKQLCGCWEQCPFCGAICTNTIPCHDGDHSVPFHRPQAITGIPWLHSDEFVLDICSNLVSSMDCLVLDNNTQILYKHYRKIGPNYANWSITPDSSFQPYWKWYVSHFRRNLENDYMLKFEKRGEIPAEWEKITKKEVIAKLKEQV